MAYVVPDHHLLCFVVADHDDGYFSEAYDVCHRYYADVTGALCLPVFAVPWFLSLCFLRYQRGRLTIYQYERTKKVHLQASKVPL